MSVGRTNTLPGDPDSRVLGFIRATVADNRDPAQRGQLRLVIPELSGGTAPHPEWARPALGFGKSDDGAWGDVDLPEIGDVVWVIFVAREKQGLFDVPVWLPGWAIEGAVPEVLRRHYPKRRGRVTPSGHSLHFDDDTGGDADSGEVKLAHRDGANLTLEGGGHAALKSKSGKKVKLQGGGRKAAGKGHAVDIGSFSVTTATVAGVTVVTDVKWTAPGGGPPVSLLVGANGKGKIDEGEDGVEIPG